MFLFRRTHASTLRSTGLCILLLSVQPAAADWLVTKEGQLIETDGSWIIDDGTVAYVDLEGDLQTLRLVEVDLEASAETTAQRRGEAHAPGQPASTETSPVAARSGAESATTANDEPRITLYETSWCGYCRKTRKLLKALDAEFVAKDIEKSREAMLEYRRKSGGRGGVPLIDFDGKVVRGYREQDIRRLAREVEQKAKGS